MNRKIEQSLWMLAGLAAAVAPLAGCRGDRSDKPPRQFFPDMDDQPKWEPQGGSEFFADGRQMRQPPKGAVAFGRDNFDPTERDDWAEPFQLRRAKLLKASDEEYLGVGPGGDFLNTIPVEVTQRLLERGRERYDIYCSSCHGYDGDGKGMVGRAWSYPLPNFHDEKYKNPAEKTGKDGYIFHVIRNGVVGPDGVQKMPGYAHAVDEADAWAIVGYFRVLQAAKAGVPLNEVPEVERQMLQQRMSRPAGGTPPPATPAPAAPAPSEGGKS